jgi:hypothetical protein
MLRPGTTGDHCDGVSGKFRTSESHSQHGLPATSEDPSANHLTNTGLTIFKSEAGSVPRNRGRKLGRDA